MRIRFSSSSVTPPPNKTSLKSVVNQTSAFISHGFEKKKVSKDSGGEFTSASAAVVVFCSVWVSCISTACTGGYS